MLLVIERHSAETISGCPNAAFYANPGLCATAIYLFEKHTVESKVMLKRCC